MIRQRGNITTSSKQIDAIPKSNIDNKAHIADNDIHSSVCTHPCRRLQTVENFIVIWLDANIDESNEDTQSSIGHLQRIVNSVKIFTDIDRCIAYLDDVKDEKVFVIVSGSFGQRFVPLIVDKNQLASIYVFCSDKNKHQKWASYYQKIKGVFVTIEDLCNYFKSDVRQREHDLASINIMSSSSTTNLDELDPSFMYSQLLKEILLEDRSTAQKKKEFVSFCRLYYSHNSEELDAIDQLEREYPRPSLIWWYTRHCFLYPMLNKALRTQDIEMIMKMGFIVRDLHQNIEELHVEQNRQESLTVYRGQGMSHIEIEKLKKSKGGLLAFNSFLSTSTDRNVSLGFAEGARDISDLTAVLFQINIDPKISTTPFAAVVGKVGYFGEGEKEILFSMHTVFRIGETRQIEEGMFEVDLTLTKENDPQLTRLLQYMREVTQGPTGLHRMGQLMCHMGEFDEAEQIYTTLIEITLKDDRQQLALFHHQLGYINKQKNNLSSAFSHYQQSLDIKLTYLPANDPQLSPTYCNMGSVLQDQDDFDGALEHLRYALKIDLNAPKPDQLSIAIRHNNIGSVLEAQGNYDEALVSYEQALDIQLARLPPGHPSVATTYNNIGLVRRKMGDNASALSYYKKTLEIFERSLPAHHPSLAISHNNIAMVLDDLHQIREAIVHAERALDITRRSLGPNHPSVQRRQVYFDELRQKL